MSKKLEIVRLSSDLPRPEFTCGDPDLDEFYKIDSIKYGLQLISTTYTVNQDDQILGFFSVSNDSIRKEDCPTGSALKRVRKNIPQVKRYSSMPAVKIGRLGINASLQSRGVGSEIIDFLKGWFTIGNKTGCRFLVVDAYNKPNVINFYKNNDFLFIEPKDKGAKTRLMYFDLISIANAENEYV